jgi:nucleoside-triphosphatase
VTSPNAIERNTRATNTSTRVLLLTGRPGVGKTTAVRRAAGVLGAARVRGFFTEEIREDGRRVGFRLRSFDGRTGVLAHVDTVSPARVGRYGVALDAFESFALRELELGSGADLWIVDEIGKMECFSRRFVDAMRRLVDTAPAPVLATVALRGGGFIEEVKRRPDVCVLEITVENREDMHSRIREWFETARS